MVVRAVGDHLESETRFPTFFRIQLELARLSYSPLDQDGNALLCAVPPERLEAGVLDGRQLYRIGQASSIDSRLCSAQHLFVERKDAADVIRYERVKFSIGY